MFAHIPEKILLTPSSEHGRGAMGDILSEIGGENSRLVSAWAQLTNLAYRELFAE